MLEKLKQTPLALSLQKQYDTMTPRDQLALKVLAVALAITIAYFAIWQPAQRYAQEAQEELSDNRELVAMIQENRSALLSLNQRKNDGGSPALDSQQLVSSVTNMAKRHGVALKRFEPSGDRTIKVWVDDASFDKMITWLSALKRSLKVEVEQISVEKDQAEGLVSARITLAS